MSQFGEYLKSKGAINEAQILEATRFQAVYGGRIGTALCDLGYLMPEDLAAHLSDHHSVPLPPPEWLDDPDEKAIHIIPLPLIRRSKVLPLKLERSKIHVVMLDPKDREQLDFLAMASEREVVPYILPEARLLYWLEVHLEIDRHPRFLGMITRPRAIAITDEELESATPMLNARQRIEEFQLQTDDQAEHPALELEPEHEPRPNDEFADQLPQVRTDRIADSLDAALAEDEPHAAVADEAEERLDDEILLLDDLVSAPDADTDPLPTAADEVAVPVAAQVETGRKASVTGAKTESLSTTVSRLEAQLQSGNDRDEIIRISLEIGRLYSESVALFMVRPDEVAGYRAFEVDMNERLRGCKIPINTPSIFTHPVHTRMPFRGDPPEGGIDGRLIESLGRPIVSEVFVHPIIIRERVVNLLYADNGSEPFGDTSIAALTALCDCLSRAYQRLITDQKRSTGD